MSDEITWCTTDNPCEDCRKLKGSTLPLFPTESLLTLKQHEILRSGFHKQLEELKESPHKCSDEKFCAECTERWDKIREAEKIFQAGRDGLPMPKASPHKPLTTIIREHIESLHEEANINEVNAGMVLGEIEFEAGTNVWDIIEEGYKGDTNALKAIKSLRKTLLAPEHQQMVDDAAKDAYETTKELPHKTPPTQFPQNKRVCGTQPCEICDKIDKDFGGLNLAEATIVSLHRTRASLRKTLQAQQEPLVHDSQHPTEIASQVGKFFEQLQDTNPDLVRTYLLHLLQCQPDHPTLRSKACDLMSRLPAYRAKKPSPPAGPSSSRWLRGGETEPYDLDTEGD